MLLLESETIKYYNRKKLVNIYEKLYKNCYCVKTCLKFATPYLLCSGSGRQKEA